MLTLVRLFGTAKGVFIELILVFITEVLHEEEVVSSVKRAVIGIVL